MSNIYEFMGSIIGCFLVALLRLFIASVCIAIGAEKLCDRQWQDCSWTSIWGFFFVLLGALFVWGAFHV